MAQQFVSLHSSVESDESRVEEKKETNAFFFEYMSRRAQKDQDLRASDAEVIKKLGQEAVQVMTDQTAVTVASKLADLGDEIDAQCQKEVMELIQLTGTPDTGFSTFFNVVRNMFEWDEHGGARITLGRLAALMSYCYHLCREYIIQKMASGSLIFSFMGRVAGWLFQFLMKARFYEWLHSHGGWGQLIYSATSNHWGTTAAIAVVSVVAVVAFSYYRNR